MGLKKTVILFLLLLSLFWACNQYLQLNRGSFISNKEEPVEMDFQMQSGLLFIEVEINHEKGLFLFDNGFTNSAINPSFAKRANIQFKSSTTSVKDANNKKSTVREVMIDTTKIQGQLFVNTPFYEIITTRFLPCDSIDGIIGASIINLANWKLDFINKKLAFSKNPFPKNGTPLSIKFSSNNSSFTPITVLDKIYNCKIDLGRSAGIKIDKEIAKESFKGQQVKKQIGIMALSASGLGQVETTYLSKDKLTIEQGSNKLEVPARINLVGDLKYEGYIGMGYLKNYEVVINSSNKRYWLSKPVIKPHKDSTYGLVVYPTNDTWKIIQINPNDSLPSKIKLMQEVTQIDSIPMSEFETICNYKSYLSAKVKRKESLKLTLKGDHSPITIPYHISNFSLID